MTVHWCFCSSFLFRLGGLVRLDVRTSGGSHHVKPKAKKNQANSAEALLTTIPSRTTQAAENYSLLQPKTGLDHQCCWTEVFTYGSRLKCSIGMLDAKPSWRPGIEFVSFFFFFFGFFVAICDIVLRKSLQSTFSNLGRGFVARNVNTSENTPSRS